MLPAKRLDLLKVVVIRNDDSVRITRKHPAGQHLAHSERTTRDQQSKNRSTHPASP